MLKITRPIGTLLTTGVVFLILALASCEAVRMNVNGTMPATRLDLAAQGVKHVAVGDIVWAGQAGSRNRVASEPAVLGEDLRAALVDLKRFEVLDRSAVDALLKEHSLNDSGLVDQKTTVAAGRFTGATALVIGQLSVYEVKSEMREQDVPRQGGGTDRFYQMSTTGSVEVSFKLIDVETGRLIAAAPCTARQTFVNPKDGFTAAQPSEPDSNQILAALRTDVVAQFVHQIAPYEVTYAVSMEDDSDIPAMSAGLKSAQLGDWKEAEASFAEAAKAKPTSAPAQYNLGVAQRAQGKFDEAIASFKTAFRLKSNTQYQDEIERTKQFMKGSKQQ